MLKIIQVIMFFSLEGFPATPVWVDTCAYYRVYEGKPSDPIEFTICAKDADLDKRIDPLVYSHFLSTKDTDGFVEVKIEDRD